MTPIRPPNPLQSLAWLKTGPLKCVKDLCARDGTLIFRAGEQYACRVTGRRVWWEELKQTSSGTVETVEKEGFESAFKVTDCRGMERWFEEWRLGLKTEGESFTIQQMVEHFDIPEVKTLADERPDEYKAAIEKIKCLTR